VPKAPPGSLALTVDDAPISHPGRVASLTAKDPLGRDAALAHHARNGTAGYGIINQGVRAVFPEGERMEGIKTFKIGQRLPRLTRKR